MLTKLLILRAKMVQKRTDYKNRAYKIVQHCNIRLGSKLYSAFGKVEIEVLEGLMSRERLQEIVIKSRSRPL